MNELRFWINGQLIQETTASPTTTLLEYLRGRLGLTGTKEGCGEGDCGACTVVLLDPTAPGGPSFRSVNACLLLLPMIHQKQVFTVEGLASAHAPHIAQQSMVEHFGSQCGYCTPGVVMSMFEACYRHDLDEAWKLDDQLAGNLCRCTGYRPIRWAAAEVAGRHPEDRFALALTEAQPIAANLDYQAGGSRFFLPETLEEVFQLLAAYPTAKLVNGGTDLTLEVKKQPASAGCWVSLERIAALNQIERRADGWSIGAGARLTDLESATREGLPAIERMLRFFGSRQIKHRATVGGNLCTASPIGDLAPIFLALGASVVLRSSTQERRLPLEKLYTSYRKTALQPGELLARVEVPAVPATARVSAYKVSKRQELDISTVAAGLYVELDPSATVKVARFGFGGMAAVPARATRTEAALAGQPWTKEALERALVELERDFKPIDDLRASAWYRRTVAGNLVRGFFLETQHEASPRLPHRPTGTVLPEVSHGH